MKEFSAGGAVHAGLKKKKTALAACSNPSPPAVKWHKDGASEQDLVADREACFDEAAQVRGETRRFDHIAKGSHFMRCMTERGWRQVPADE